MRDSRRICAHCKWQLENGFISSAPEVCPVPIYEETSTCSIMAQRKVQTIINTKFRVEAQAVVDGIVSTLLGGR